MKNVKRGKIRNKGRLKNKASVLPGVSLLSSKQTLASGLLMELQIWSVKDADKYPLGLRYRMVLVDPNSGVVKLLMDNHWPKGPHIHFGPKEKDYPFENVDKLIKEFYRLCDEIEEKQ